MNGEITESPEPETEGVDPADPFAQVRAAIERMSLNGRSRFWKNFRSGARSGILCRRRCSAQRSGIWRVNGA